MARSDPRGMIRAALTAQAEAGEWAEARVGGALMDLQLLLCPLRHEVSQQGVAVAVDSQHQGWESR
jgi:hypothetical protein